MINLMESNRFVLNIEMNDNSSAASVIFVLLSMIAIAIIITAQHAEAGEKGANNFWSTMRLYLYITIGREKTRERERDMHYMRAHLSQEHAIHYNYSTIVL